MLSQEAHALLLALERRSCALYHDKKNPCSRQLQKEREQENERERDRDRRKKRKGKVKEQGSEWKKNSVVLDDPDLDDPEVFPLFPRFSRERETAERDKVLIF